MGIVCGIHMLEAGYDIASYWMMDHVRTQTLRQEIIRQMKAIIAAVMRDAPLRTNADAPPGKKRHKSSDGKV